MTKQEIEKLKQLAKNPTHKMHSEDKAVKTRMFNTDDILSLLDRLEKAEKVMSRMLGAARDCQTRDEEERNEAVISMNENIDEISDWLRENE